MESLEAERLEEFDSNSTEVLKHGWHLLHFRLLLMLENKKKALQWQNVRVVSIVRVDTNVTIMGVLHYYMQHMNCVQEFQILN